MVYLVQLGFPWWGHLVRRGCKVKWVLARQLVFDLLWMLLGEREVSNLAHIAYRGKGLKVDVCTPALLGVIFLVVFNTL